MVGFADSMTKVLPRAGVPKLATASRVEVRLARNEKEALQVIVVPVERDLDKVKVRVRDLRGPGGALFPADRVDTVPVGYVQTKAVPPYGSSHVGWWPDPILDFLGAVDIAKGDAQAFWVRVRAPKGQAPGQYSGKLDVLIGGELAFTFDLGVRVYRFTLPDASPLPLAITFAPHDHPTAGTKAEQVEWRKSKDYPVNAWRAHAAEWADLLADYYITYDSLYGYQNWEPDFTLLQRLHARGQLGRFNLGYYAKCPADPAAIEKWKASTLARLRPHYERAKALGILDRAYIYGCDEHKKGDFPHVQRAARLIKAAFPDVMVMTTTYDHNYGLDSAITAMDAFCPLTPRLDPAKAAKARAAGKQVWWYICCGPHHPHANMF
ncbi:glycoside hydrolase domain-containing protein, partial [Planctomycetota bacterium]